ncbi:diphthine--ammonia ligase [Chryseobacterium daecheongense]|nr:diphthine--ammonia ligase [Chryseobacterium daecheongense]
MKPKALFNWSSGKDSALALYKTFKEEKLDIIGLLTSINQEYQRISMHGVHVSLLEEQASSIGLPLIKMELPKEPSMEQYRDIMNKTMTDIKSRGVTHSIFGDIFLEDLRKYREDQLKSIGMEAVFPLWKKDTKKLIHEFLDLGFKTIVICVNETYLDKSFAGRIIDENFISDLPENVDPCGENGEFHTFTFDGPIFKTPIQFEIGDIVKKTYPKPNAEDHENGDEYVFWFCDLIKNKTL